MVSLSQEMDYDLPVYPDFVSSLREPIDTSTDCRDDIRHNSEEEAIFENNNNVVMVVMNTFKVVTAIRKKVEGFR